MNWEGPSIIKKVYSNGAWVSHKTISFISRLVNLLERKINKRSTMLTLVLKC